MATQVTILGAGPGGYVAAVRAAQLGAVVTVVGSVQQSHSGDRAGSRIHGYRGRDEGLTVTIGPSPFASDLKEKDKIPVTETVAQALVCIGRTPNNKAIGLSTIGLATD